MDKLEEKYLKLIKKAKTDKELISIINMIYDDGVSDTEETYYEDNPPEPIQWCDLD